MQMADVPLTALKRGARGRVAQVLRDLTGRADRLAALGVSRGAAIHVLQTFPAIVVEIDQTELAVEHAIARIVLVQVQ
jgi:Fe2+ transport system protein FeoA